MDGMCHAPRLYFPLFFPDTGRITLRKKSAGVVVTYRRPEGFSRYSYILMVVCHSMTIKQILTTYGPATEKLVICGVCEE